MGNYTSKFSSNDSEQESAVKVTETVEQSNLVHACNSITPPTTRRKLTVDPRSITTEIPRTPIEVNCTPSNNTKMAMSAIPKRLQPKPYLETYFGATMSPQTSNRYLDPRSPNVDHPRTPIFIDNLSSCKTPTNGLKHNENIIPSTNFAHFGSLGLDPRSPSVDFDRTPIVISKTNKYIKTESMENLQSHNETEDHKKFLYCETTSFNTPEILALVDETFEALKSLQLNNPDSMDKSELHADENTNQVNDEHESNDNACSKKSLQNENSLKINIIKVWRDSMLSENLEHFGINELSDQENDEEKFSCPSKEEIEVMFDDDVIKENTPIQEQPRTEIENKNVQDALENKKKVKTNATITNGKTFIPYNSNINEISKKRTPLRNRCNNAQLDTILTKSPQHVLQNKNFSATIEHENTPPHKRCYAKSKVKGIQWDVNSTVII